MRTRVLVYNVYFQGKRNGDGRISSPKILEEYCDNLMQTREEEPERQIL